MAFLDTGAIDDGDHFPERQLNGILDASIVVIFATQAYSESRFCRLEMTWSPDGKWLAALEKGEHGRTILLDATVLTRRRVLGNSELGWSPDSRYLLGVKENDRCGSYSSTLQKINVETFFLTS